MMLGLLLVLWQVFDPVSVSGLALLPVLPLVSVSVLLKLLALE